MAVISRHCARSRIVLQQAARCATVLHLNLRDAAVLDSQSEQSHALRRQGCRGVELCYIQHPHRTFARRQAPWASYLGRVVCTSFRARASAGEQSDGTPDDDLFQQLRPSPVREDLTTPRGRMAA
jgi:hypothetical protein